MKKLLSILFCLCVLALTASAQKISQMTLTNPPPGNSRLELSVPDGAGNHVTRASYLSNAVIRLFPGTNVVVIPTNGGMGYVISADPGANYWGAGGGKVFPDPVNIIHGNGGGLSNAVAFIEGDNITITSADNGRTWTISSTGGGGDIDTNLWILRDAGHGTNTTIWGINGMYPFIAAQIGLGYYYNPDGDVLADFGQNELFATTPGGSSVSVDWGERLLQGSGGTSLDWTDAPQAYMGPRIPAFAGFFGSYFNTVYSDINGRLFIFPGASFTPQMVGADTNIFLLTNGVILQVGNNGVGTMVSSNVISAIGDDTDVNIKVRPQGYGQVEFGPGGWDYATASSGAGSLIFNSGDPDSPGIKFAFDDNQNFALDVASGALRFVHNADESGGAVIGTLDSSGNLSIIGKLDATGGVDPPYVLYDANTRGGLKGRVLKEVPAEKQTGAALYFNADNKRLEFYVASEDKFFDILGNELETGTVTTIEPPPRKPLPGLTNNVPKLR